jgi:hypothetical protein
MHFSFRISSLSAQIFHFLIFKRVVTGIEPTNLLNATPSTEKPKLLAYLLSIDQA